MDIATALTPAGAMAATPLPAIAPPLRLAGATVAAMRPPHTAPPRQPVVATAHPATMPARPRAAATAEALPLPAPAAVVEVSTVAVEVEVEVSTVAVAVAAAEAPTAAVAVVVPTVVAIVNS